MPFSWLNSYYCVPCVFTTALGRCKPDKSEPVHNLGGKKEIALDWPVTDQTNVPKTLKIN
jgi:hypothetical protein